MQWNSSYQESIFSFANNINTHEGGTHLSGFRSALTRTLNAYAREKRAAQGEGREPQGEDVREGLTAIVSVKLARSPVRGPDEVEARQPADQGPRRVDRQPQAWRVPRGEPGRRPPDPHQGGRRRARPRRRTQGARPDPAQVGARELDPAGQARRLLGEGPGAGGDLHRRGRLGRRLGKQARDRNTQAVLPLRGKIINVEKSRIDKVLSNEEIQALITAIGTGVRDEFDIEQLRYHKVILMTDADVDGAHIRTLVLTFLYREMQELIEAGYVYIAKPPLYKVKKRQAGDLRRERVRARGAAAPRQARGVRGLRLRRAGRSSSRSSAGRRSAGSSRQYEGWASTLRAEYGHDGDRLPRGVRDPRRRRLDDGERRQAVQKRRGPEGRALRDRGALAERRRPAW